MVAPVSDGFDATGFTSYSDPSVWINIDYGTEVTIFGMQIVPGDPLALYDVRVQMLNRRGVKVWDSTIDQSNYDANAATLVLLTMTGDTWL